MPRRGANLRRRIAKGDQTAQRNRISSDRRGAKVDQFPAGIRGKPHDARGIQLAVDNLPLVQLAEHLCDLRDSRDLECVREDVRRCTYRMHEVASFGGR